MALLAVAFITLLERKILSLSQLRLGPNKTSIYGILQPVLDGLKLIFKKNALLMNKQTSRILLGPGTVFFIMIGLWTILPWSFLFISFKYSLLLLFRLIRIISYGIVLVGWGSTSIFSKLGRSRGILQNLAIEISLIIFFFISFRRIHRLTLNSDKGYSECFYFWLIILIILALTDCNRAPIDLMEGERELIRGFNLELGRLVFVFIFLGEYGIIIIFSHLSLNYFSRNKSIVTFLVFSRIFLFLRSCFPRIRYEQIIFIIWQEFLLACIFLWGLFNLL
jgi:NADH:ubiquinone oxidoreductase subunit H